MDGLVKTGVLREMAELGGVGHRIVHGGDVFSEPVEVDDAVLDRIRELSRLAPLHNPAGIAGIEVMRQLAPGIPQVAVFDTAFHQTMPPEAATYALPPGPRQDHGLRRYGFHGTSHRYVSRAAARQLGRAPDETNLITLHLGNGVSAAAIRGGRSVDTSMGFTPLEGLVMGSRCGDLDPAIPLFLIQQAGYRPDQVDDLLNRASGLKGLCGANDMREVLQRAGEGDADAELALSLFCYRVRKYIGAYFAVLGRLDALVFTAGIGEHNPEVRRRCCMDLQHLGVILDPARNEQAVGKTADISPAGAPTRVLVIPTDEELEIAHATRHCLEG
jgi:acetate kinase